MNTTEAAQITTHSGHATGYYRDSDGRIRRTPTDAEQNTILAGRAFTVVPAGEWTYLISDKGAAFYLRGSQVISQTSGRPLRIGGTEIRVAQVGAIIEQAR